MRSQILDRGIVLDIGQQHRGRAADLRPLLLGIDAPGRGIAERAVEQGHLLGAERAEALAILGLLGDRRGEVGRTGIGQHPPLGSFEPGLGRGELPGQILLGFFGRRNLGLKVRTGERVGVGIRHLGRHLRIAAGELDLRNPGIEPKVCLHIVLQAGDQAFLSESGSFSFDAECVKRRGRRLIPQLAGDAFRQASAAHQIELCLQEAIRLRWGDLRIEIGVGDHARRLLFQLDRCNRGVTTLRKQGQDDAEQHCRCENGQAKLVLAVDHRANELEAGGGRLPPGRIDPLQLKVSRICGNQFVH